MPRKIRTGPEQLALPLFAVGPVLVPSPRKTRVPFTPPKRISHPGFAPSRGRPSPVVSRRGFRPQRE